MRNARTKQRPHDPVREPLPRTIRLSGQAWEVAKARAKKDGQPVRDLLDAAVDQEMGAVVQDLRRSGVTPESLPDKQVRVPLSDTLLDRIRQAKLHTGLAGNHLLSLCMLRYAGRGRRGGRRRKST